MQTSVPKSEEAVDHLDQVVKNDPRISAGWVRIDPDFLPHGDPRFGRLVDGS